MARILIADDQPFFLDGLEAFLTGQGHAVVARASDAGEVHAAVNGGDPELIILDTAISPAGGVELLKSLRLQGHRQPIILTTANVNASEALEAMRLEVNGIVIKHSAPALLVRCIDAALSGQCWFDRDIMDRALKQSIQPIGAHANPPANLTGREQSIMLLVARGLTNREIAEQTGVTEGTVKVHLHNIYRKLDIDSRTRLAVMVKEHDWA